MYTCAILPSKRIEYHRSTTPPSMEIALIFWFAAVCHRRHRHLRRLDTLSIFICASDSLSAKLFNHLPIFIMECSNFGDFPVHRIEGDVQLFDTTATYRI